MSNHSSLPAADFAVPARIPSLRRGRPRRLRIVTIGLAGVVAFLVLGNLFIVAAWRVESRSVDPAASPLRDVDNFRALDERLWRGAAPSGADAYVDLAARGVTTVVDLRAEDDVDVDADELGGLGLALVRIPLRDGQTPTSDQVSTFLDAVAASPGTTFVHCGAGVGRAGTMAAAYSVAAGRAGGVEAMRANLAVGPPSLEQLVFAAGLDGGVDRPHPVVVATSRVLDAPRRLWSRFGW